MLLCRRVEDRRRMNADWNGTRGRKRVERVADAFFFAVDSVDVEVAPVFVAGALGTLEDIGAFIWLVEDSVEPAGSSEASEG